MRTTSFPARSRGAAGYSASFAAFAAARLPHHLPVLFFDLLVSDLPHDYLQFFLILFSRLLSQCTPFIEVFRLVGGGVPRCAFLQDLRASGKGWGAAIKTSSKRDSFSKRGSITRLIDNFFNDFDAPKTTLRLVDYFFNIFQVGGISERKRFLIGIFQTNPFRRVD